MPGTRWRWIFQQWMKRLWVRASLFCVLGVATALIAKVLSPYIPTSFGGDIGADAVESILGILASSMLTVAVFSLSTMVSAASAAANGATPRAARLLLEDSTAQSALSTFLGGFLFSLVGIIALNTNYYGEGARSIMFVVTLAVIGVIIATLLQWIDYLSRLGRVGETIDLVERRAIDQMKRYVENPLLGARRGPTDPEGDLAVHSGFIGYVQHLDVEKLSSLCDELDCEIHVVTRPGGYCSPARPLAVVNRKSKGDEAEAQEVKKRVRSAFAVGDSRSFEQDPRFGQIVLCEIGCRALSAAINDSGTAIDVIGTQVRVLAHAAGDSENSVEVKYPRVSVPPIEITDFLEDAFFPIARDGAGRLEVLIRLLKAADALSGLDDPRFKTAARELSDIVLARGLAELTLPLDRERLQATAAQTGIAAGGPGG